MRRPCARSRTQSYSATVWTLSLFYGSADLHTERGCVTVAHPHAEWKYLSADTPVYKLANKTRHPSTTDIYPWSYGQSPSGRLSVKLRCVHTIPNEYSDPQDSGRCIGSWISPLNHAYPIATQRLFRSGTSSPVVVREVGCFLTYVILDIYCRLPNAKLPEVAATECEYRITRVSDQSTG